MKAKSITEFVQHYRIRTFKHGSRVGMSYANRSKQPELNLTKSIRNMKQRGIGISTSSVKLKSLSFDAGECIDQSARAQADFASVENDSFQLLSDFENQSQLLQDAVIARDQIEKVLEGDRLESSGIGGGAGKDKDLSTSIGANAKELQGANELVERRQTELNSAWVKVEGTWERSFTSNMARSEFSYQARRLHRQAELAFRESKELKSSMQYLGEKRERLGESQASLSKELDEHQRNGAEKFDCSIISDFLFWAHEDRCTCGGMCSADR